MYSHIYDEISVISVHDSISSLTEDTVHLFTNISTCLEFEVMNDVHEFLIGAIKHLRAHIWGSSSSYTVLLRTVKVYVNRLSG